MPTCLSPACTHEPIRPLVLPVPTAGGVYSVLQRARFVAACRPLHPDAVVTMQGVVQHFGLSDCEPDAPAVE